MRYQQRPYSCGAAAVVNALRCYGKRIPEKLVRSRAGTTKKDGTQEEPMKEALKSFGFTGDSFDHRVLATAVDELQVHVGFGRPIVICVQKDQHWVVIVGMLGPDRYVVIDSARTEYNKEENGVRVLSRKQLSKFWKNKRGVYSGFAVKKLP